MPHNLKDALMGGPGLDGYAFNADTYCVDCGRDIIREVFKDTREPGSLRELDDLAFRDSETCPQPIFFGESDTATHCGTCGEYMYGPKDEDTDDDEDPTRWCDACGAMHEDECSCGPIAENE